VTLDWTLILCIAVLIAPIALPLLLIRETPLDRLWCKGEHDWINEGWFSKCSRCPAEYNHYDRPGGAGWG
jgi:hypothetical protein